MSQSQDDPLLTQPIAAPAKAGGGGGKSAPAAPSAESVEQLASMGFTAAQARHALRQCDNNVERAVDWLFNHPEAGLDEPEPTAVVHASAGAGAVGGAAVVDASPKLYQLFGFIVHKGNTIQSGHYVAYLWSAERAHWILYDDERVSVSEKPPIDQAYLYLFRRLAQ